MKENKLYVRNRTALIPTARKTADKEKTEARKMYVFTREMTRLSEEAGLIGPGNLDLFDSTKIPPFDVERATVNTRK